MLLKNLELDCGERMLVNGSRGVITKFVKKQVRFCLPESFSAFSSPSWCFDEAWCAWASVKKSVISYLIPAGKMQP